MNIAEQSPLEEGAELFNEHSFWEAHEAWELFWKTSFGIRRTSIQAFIQAAAAFHHLFEGRLIPARSLSRLSLEKLKVSSTAQTLESDGLQRVLEKLSTINDKTQNIEDLKKMILSLKVSIRR